MNTSHARTPWVELPVSLANADLATVLCVYDSAAAGLLRTDPFSGDERRRLLNDLHAHAAGEPAAVPGCPVVGVGR
jgi:hypothetical protein